MKILTRNELDEILTHGCTNPGCEHNHEKMSELFLQPDCHPGVGCDICYSAEGLLKLTCRSCEQEICYIAVGGAGADDRPIDPGLDSKEGNHP